MGHCDRLLANSSFRRLGRGLVYVGREAGPKDAEDYIQVPVACVELDAAITKFCDARDSSTWPSLLDISLQPAEIGVLNKRQDIPYVSYFQL